MTAETPLPRIRVIWAHMCGPSCNRATAASVCSRPGIDRSPPINNAQHGHNINVNGQPAGVRHFAFSPLVVHCRSPRYPLTRARYGSVVTRRLGSAKANIPWMCSSCRGHASQAHRQGCRAEMGRRSTPRSRTWRSPFTNVVRSTKLTHFSSLPLYVERDFRRSGEGIFDRPHHSATAARNT